LRGTSFRLGAALPPAPLTLAGWGEVRNRESSHAVDTFARCGFCGLTMQLEHIRWLNQRIETDWAPTAARRDQITTRLLGG
jgi:hypothetical protein